MVIPVALNYLGLSEVADLLLRLGRWPAMFVVLTLALAVIYRYGPSREAPRWRWITWGSAPPRGSTCKLDFDPKLRVTLASP